MTILDLVFEGLPELKIDLTGNLREKELSILHEYRKMIVRKLDLALKNGNISNELGVIIKHCLVID